MTDTKKTAASKKRWGIKKAVLWLVSLVLLLIIGFLAFVIPSKNDVPELEVIDQYVYLNDSWGDSFDAVDRQTYYYTPQGASMPQGADLNALRYAWFIHLEQPLSEARFADPDYMRRFKFLVDENPSAKNPDHLPVGFTRHFNANLGQDVLDLTCAACHTGELHFKKEQTTYALRIDGGQAMHAFTDMKEGSFGPMLLAALIETYVNPAKFSRFAQNVLGSNKEQHSSTLRVELYATIKAFLSIKQNNPLRRLYTDEEGFGRTDALDRIANTVFGDHLVSSNLQKSTAPVSYPYLWNIWKFNWVQYNGSVAQPLARNIGEVLGVGAVIPLTAADGTALPATERFRSSVLVPELEAIENTLQTLRPPQWPHKLFGPIDETLADQGKQLFQNHCKECHGPHVASEARQRAEAPLKPSPETQWLIEVIPQKHIGTDSNATDAFMDRTYDLSSTGITSGDIANVLSPLLRRQLARDVLYRLQSLAVDEQSSEAQKLALIELIAQYPAPDALADRDFTDSPFPQIQQQLLAHELNPTQEIRKDFSQDEQIQCDRDCLLNGLAWDLRFGQQAVVENAHAFDPRKLTEGVALNIVGLLIKNRYYQDNHIDNDTQQCLEGFGTLDLPQQIRGYKPRPLAGVWATPPFLHNGSVPSIYEMLLPPSKRTTRFFVGPREYDPVHLGYALQQAPKNEHNGFWMDTRTDGNRNTGHGFSATAEQWEKYRSDAQKFPLPSGVIGPEFTEQQRFALIEYLKIHQDTPDTPAEFQPRQCLARAN